MRRPGQGVLAGLAQQLAGEIAGKAAMLGDRQKAVGRHLAELGVRPARKRLEGDHLVGAQIDERLIVGLDRAGLERRQQPALQAVALAQVRVHGRLEEAQARAALLLGPVEGDIGLAQQLVGQRSVPRGESDADADADLMPGGPRRDRRAQLVDDAERDVGGILGPRHMAG